MRFAPNEPLPKTVKASESARWVHDVAALFGTSDMSLHTIEIFLRVADADGRGEPLDSREIARLIGKSCAAVSRNIGRLGDWSRNKDPGMGLITAIPDRADRRRKPIRLTAKGRQLLRLIEGL